MRSNYSVGILFALMFVLIGCSSNGDSSSEESADTSARQSTTGTPTHEIDNEVETNSSTESTVQHDTSSDVIVAESLDDLIATADVIVITREVQPTEIINMARNEATPDEPDEHVFVLGQVYEIEVDRYLKGHGESTLQVVQREGFIYDHDDPVAQALTEGEADSIKQESFDNDEHFPMSSEQTYVMFLLDLGGFDPELGYLTGTHGAPWRFELTEDGSLVPESQSEEANQHIGTLELNEVATVINESSQ